MDNPYVVAFHGWKGQGKLKEDMGNPDWVTKYVDDWDLQSAIYEVQTAQNSGRPVVIFAYSLAGELAGFLTFFFPDLAAIILYEAPLLSTPKVYGDCPVLMIWNNKGRKYSKHFILGRRYREEVLRTERIWRNSEHPLSTMLGVGRHTKWPLRHGVDLNIVPKIKQWLDILEYRGTIKKEN